MRVLFGAVTALAIGLGSVQAMAVDKLDFVLNWKPGGDHAPIYWAKAEGWYEKAGIDLNIVEGSGSGASAKKVGIGQTPIGIMDLPTGLQFKGNGGDLVAVMNIYANNPYGIYWRKSSGIKTYKDLAGKKIGNPPFDAARKMWPAIAKALDIDPDSVSWVNIKPLAKAAALKSGAIDATTNFYNVHYIYEKIFGDDMGFVALRDVGFNPYGNSIVVNGKFMKENPDLIRRFVQTTQKAYQACVANSEPCNAELARAGSQKAEAVNLNWAKVLELMTAESAQKGGLGYFDPARMQQDYEWVKASFDIKDFDVKSAYTNEFLDTSIKMP